jgi:hypothetical protein
MRVILAQTDLIPIFSFTYARQSKTKESSVPWLTLYGPAGDDFSPFIPASIRAACFGSQAEPESASFDLGTSAYRILTNARISVGHVAA